MGQRSQIYVKFESEERKILLARYYQWCYGERMISRAKHAIEYLKCIASEISNFHYWYENDSNLEKFIRILDTNFDMEDVVVSTDIIQEYKDWGDDSDFLSYVFKGQDNNDGQLYLYVTKDCTIKYLFTDYELKDIMDPHRYMQEYMDDLKERDPEAAKLCEDNTKYIEDNAILMTDEEWQDLLKDDYSSLVQNKSTEREIAEFKLAIAWNKLKGSKKSYKGISVSDLLNGMTDDTAAWQVRRWAKWFGPGWTTNEADKGNMDKYLLNRLKQYIDDQFEIDPEEEIWLYNIGMPLTSRGEFCADVSGPDHLSLINKCIKKFDQPCINKVNAENEELCFLHVKTSGHGKEVELLITFNSIDSVDFGAKTGCTEKVPLGNWEEWGILKLLDDHCRSKYGLSLQDYYNKI